MRSAERFAFHLISAPQAHRKSLKEAIETMEGALAFCQDCGSLAGDKGCSICQDLGRNHQQLCIVAHPKDVFSIEQTKAFSGIFHVLGTLVSPIEGKTLDVKTLDLLHLRLQKHNVQEVIIALDSTLEGDATALFLKKMLTPLNLSVSRLAFGLPMGSSLDYVDGGTLARALSGRRSF